MYDLVIAGAGTAGCLAARTASKLGLKTCLLDVKPQQHVGDKACGDAVGKHHFDDIGLAYPRGDELSGELEGCRLYSPSRKASLMIEGFGARAFMVNRHAFGQRLLKETRDAGAELMDRTKALTPVIRGRSVSGVLARFEDGEGKTELPAKIVVDATGMQAALRSQLPDELGLERHVDPLDVQVAYRELVRPSTTLECSEYGEIYLSATLVPGGYAWLFPKGGGLVNAGLGVHMRRDHPHPRERFREFFKGDGRLEGADVLDARGALVPTRRPLDSLVADGFMVAGDAACQVNPIHGGGIGPSMIGGRLAAEAAAKAIESGDLTRRGLWSYNVLFMRGYGAKQATLDVLRRFLQAAGDEDLDHGMEHRVIREREILKASLRGTMRLSISEKAVMFFRARGRLSFLRKLRRTARQMALARNHYESFPEIEGYAAWLETSRMIFKSPRAGRGSGTATIPSL